MYKISIVRHYEDKDSIYCGRGSPYGNPYPIDTKHSRDDVCDVYEDYFNFQIVNNPEFLIEIKKLHQIGKKQGYLKLGCYCNPLRCHLETIKHFIEHNYELLDNDFT